MGLLVNYFKGLKIDDEIDSSISDAMLGHASTDKGKSFNRTNWTETGIYLSKFHSWYIPYVERKINSHLVLPYQDALSAGFSGCAMARFLNYKGTETHVAHIWLQGEYEHGDCRNEWINFCESNNYNHAISIFRPKAIKNTYDYLNRRMIITKCGLISSNKEMFDITLLFDTDRKCYFKKMVKNKPSFRGSKSEFLPIAEDEEF